MKSQQMKHSNTWSPLSNVTVPLKPSTDYQKGLLLIYVFLVLAVWTSNLHWLLCVSFVFYLGIYCLLLSRQKTPGNFCIQIQYVEHAWWLYRTAEQCQRYDVARIKFDFGWLMWLVFESRSASEKRMKQNILLFDDQMQADDHRLLRVLLRVLY